MEPYLYTLLHLLLVFVIYLLYFFRFYYVFSGSIYLSIMFFQVLLLNVADFLTLTHVTMGDVSSRGKGVMGMLTVETAVMRRQNVVVRVVTCTAKTKLVGLTMMYVM